MQRIYSAALFANHATARQFAGCVEILCRFKSSVRQGSGHATSAASSPIFRARKTSLVQTECPSAPVVLD